MFYLATDLSANNAAMQVADWTKKHTGRLAILINNAGYGLWGDFEKLVK